MVPSSARAAGPRRVQRKKTSRFRGVGYTPRLKKWKAVSLPLSAAAARGADGGDGKVITVNNKQVRILCAHAPPADF